jgi:hypothetical protein
MALTEMCDRTKRTLYRKFWAQGYQEEHLPLLRCYAHAGIRSRGWRKMAC